MFVKVGDRISVEDLLRGIIVQSGNDACIVVAEGLSGSESAFADAMTDRGREIGLQRSTFRNATGWPDPQHMMTARDLAILAKRIIQDYPEYYHYYSEKNFTYAGIRQGNRNPLLYKSLGADGLKTGHTEVSGYGLTASAKRGDRRIILVLNGLESVRHRSQEAERLLEWGFREFENLSLFKAGETVAEADVWLGIAPTVPLVVERDVLVTLSQAARRTMKVSVVYDGPIPAPIKQGTPLARVQIASADTETIEVPLVAGADVERLGFFGRLTSAAGYLLWGAAAAIKP
jgi:D-alanyl-D-alanine carboxypeptidase (penicillin-binding protein 5/6)